MTPKWYVRVWNPDPGAPLLFWGLVAATSAPAAIAIVFAPAGRELVNLDGSSSRIRQLESAELATADLTIRVELTPRSPLFANVAHDGRLVAPGSPEGAELYRYAIERGRGGALEQLERARQ